MMADHSKDSALSVVDDDDDDPSADAMQIAAAFRQATETDEMNAMNACSHRRHAELAQLHYYVVPAAWMRKAWPILTSRTASLVDDKHWRETCIGTITLASLLDDGDVVSQNNNSGNVAAATAAPAPNAASDAGETSSSTSSLAAQQKSLMLNEIQTRADNNNDNDMMESSLHDDDSHHRSTGVNNSSANGTTHHAQPQQQQQHTVQQQQQQQPYLLRRGLHHAQDYFLLGASAWMLVGGKFGYDHEIRLRCAFDGISVAVVVPQRGGGGGEGGSGSGGGGEAGVPQQQQNQQQNPTAATRHDNSRQNNETRIHIPPTGRFGYETVLNAGKANGSAGAGANGGAGAGELNGAPNVPGNVSDDEGSSMYGSGHASQSSMAKDDDDRMSTDKELEPQHDSSPHQHSSVILLPPSSTPAGSILSTPTPMRIGDESNSSNSNFMGATSYESDNIIGSTPAVIGWRKYGSGLGNLGNTCFMNSTLQCLAHTDPLRQYFISGQYEAELNRDNPLGTGGELATQFAELLSEMWGLPAPTQGPAYGRTVGPFQRNYRIETDVSATHIVYPRNFKTTLGRHAEQFMGFDQHDSQELATYLLDALHEDTNRVTEKPYVEKPEQAVNETDEEASEKAWALHLKREDSRVLENFMGQVKSRVQCCEQGCGRVSTTFDPFMYLSVPIPGSTDRALPVTFVPLDPMKPPKTFSLTLRKMATIEELVKKLRDRLEQSGYIDEKNLPLDDLCPVDIFNGRVWGLYKSDEDIDKINSTDVTYVYQLRSLKEIQGIESRQKSPDAENIAAGADESLGLENERKRYQLDLVALAQLNRRAWQDAIVEYINNSANFFRIFNPTKGSVDERVNFYNRLTRFLDKCQNAIDEGETDGSGQKRLRDDSSPAETSKRQLILAEEGKEKISVPALVELCDGTPYLKDIVSLYDLAVLDFLSRQMRQAIIRLEKDKVPDLPDGFTIEVHMRTRLGWGTRKLPPFILRLHSKTTVYELREELARRLERSIKSGRSSSQPIIAPSGQATSERHSLSEADNVNARDCTFGSPTLLLLRRIPLSFERKQSPFRYNTNSPPPPGKKLGSLESAITPSRGPSLASPTDEDEKALVSVLVGDTGLVCVDLPTELADECFDIDEYEKVLDESEDADTSVAARTRRQSNSISVLDCIEKYCQKEQLEETEMWYCNQCKKHVQAWKQFHLYRAPPILIIHLKRFHYSARNHRRDKISLPVDFPLREFDLRQQFSQWDESESPVYDCYAVSNHYGGLGGGHYTAYALNEDGEWCYYDDSRISPNATPEDIVSDAAYVLYYRRRDVQVGRGAILRNTQTYASETPVIIPDQQDRASEVSSQGALIGDDEMDLDDSDDASHDNAMLFEADDGHSGPNLPLQ